MSIRSALQEGDISPRPRTIAPGNQNDFFHLIYPKSKPPGKGEPAVNVLEYPLSKVSPRASILTLSLHRKGQHRAAAPSSARKRGLVSFFRPDEI